MDKNKILLTYNNKLREYYPRKDAKFEMIRFLYNREFAYLVPSWLQKWNMQGISEISSRNYRCHSVQTIDWMMHTRLLDGFSQKVFNLYTSLATYDGGVPMSQWKEKDRGLTDWRAHCHEKIAGFDFLIDIDARPFKHWKEAKEDCINIHGLLNDCEVSHEIRFSGSGFHLIVPYSALPKMDLNPQHEVNLYSFLAIIQKGIHKHISNQVDKTTFDSRQLVKLPYSVANRREGQYLCLPILNDDALRVFDPNDHAAIDKNPSVAYRGSAIFNQENINDPDKFREFVKRVV